MLVPKIKLEETFMHLSVTVYVPLSVVRNCVISVENQREIRFFNRPYFIHLILPVKFKVWGVSYCKYIQEGKKFVFNVNKLVPGQDFTELCNMKLVVHRSIASAGSEGDSKEGRNNEGTNQNEKEDLDSDDDCIPIPVAKKCKYGEKHRLEIEFTPTPRTESDGETEVITLD